MLNLKKKIIFITIALLAAGCPLRSQTTNEIAVKNINHLASNQRGVQLLEIAECSHQGELYKSSSLSINAKGPTLILKGSDHSANPWSVESSLHGSDCSIYLADFPGSTQQSIVLFIPGIGSRGSFENTLTLIQFNEQGTPIPWTATGHFTQSATGIQQLVRSDAGKAMVIHSYGTGLPAWGGITYLTYLYEITTSGVSSLKGEYFGTSFPAILGPKEQDLKLRQTSERVSLSISDSSINANLKTAQSTTPHFVKYDQGTIPQYSSTPIDHIATGQSGYPTFDISGPNMQNEPILLSDGTRLALPSILMIDLQSGERQIVVSPKKWRCLQR